MDIYPDSLPAQMAVILFILLFAYLSRQNPRRAALLFPIILPLYLIKIQLKFPVPSSQFPAINTIPTNLLEILMIIFLIVNFKLVWQGIHQLAFQVSRYFIFAAGCLLLAVILSTVYAINLPTALGAAKSWFVLPMLLFFALLPTLQSPRYRQKFLYFLALSGAVITLMTLPFIWQNLYGYDGRLTGIFLSPNHLAMALVPGILALVIPLSSSGSSILSFPRRRESRIVLRLLLFLELVILYLTYSYGAWIGLFVAILFLPHQKSTSPLSHPYQGGGLRGGIAEGKKLIAYGLGLTAILVTVFLSQLSNPKLQHIIKGDYYSSLHSRLMIWQSALVISKDYWLTGIGAGNFQQAYLDYQKYFPEPYIEWAVPQPHNILLAFLTELGITGLIGFILILITTLKKLMAYGLWLMADPLTLWAFAYLIYTIIHGLIDTPYFKNDLAIVFWLALAAIWASQPKQKSRQS